MPCNSNGIEQENTSSQSTELSLQPTHSNFLRLDPQRKLKRSRIYQLSEDEANILFTIDSLIQEAATTTAKFQIYNRAPVFEHHVERLEAARGGQRVRPGE